MIRALAVGLAVGLATAAAGQETLQLPHEQPQEPKKAPVLTRAPVLLTFVPAVYPPEAEKAGLMGDVGLELDLGVDGKVTAVRLTQPAGQGFDEAAMAAAKQFVFSPAELDNQPAAVTIGYVYHFVLRKVAPAPPPPTNVAVTVPVAGTVLERSTKKPLGGATVHVSGLQAELTTDTEGRFDAAVPQGQQTFELFTAGYEPLVKSIAVKGKKLELTFFLRPKIEGFHTVVRTHKEEDVVEQYTLDREEVRRAPGTFGDPLHVITDLPGVARSPFDLGFLVVRGADPADTDFYFDGLEVPLIYHFLGGPAVINPEFLDKIDFYPGGQGAKYGHAIGGTVDVTSRTLELDRIHAVADVNTDFASGFADAPLGDGWRVALAGRRSYFDLLLKPFLGAGVVVVPYFWDYQFKIEKSKPADHNSFYLMAYGSNDTLDLATGNSAVVPGGFTLNYSSLFHHVVANWTYKNGPFKSSLSAMGGYEANNIDSFAGVNNDVYVAAVRHDMSYEVSPKLRFEFGEDFSYQVTYYDLSIPTIPDYNVFPGSAVEQGTESLSRVFHQLDVAPWVQAILQLPNGIKIIPGVRADLYHVPSGYREDVEPRLVLRWQLTDRLLAKGSVGLYDQPPLAEYFDAQYGTASLLLQSAWQYSGGFEFKIIPPLTFSAVGFYSDRFNLVQGGLGPSLPGTPAFSNNGLGRAYGLEVFLHHDITSRLFGWLSYTLSRSEYDTGVNQQWGLSGYDETHILTAVASYNIGWGFLVGARFRLISGTPFTPITDSSYDGDQDAYIPIYGPYQSTRLPIFKQLDVRVDKEFSFDRWKLDLYLDVWNVTNAQNEEGTIYDYRYRTFTIIPSYPILPMLGVRGEY